MGADKPLARGLTMMPIHNCDPSAMETFVGVRMGLRASLDVDAWAREALKDAEEPLEFASQLLAGDDCGVESAASVLSSFPSRAPFVDQLSMVIATWFTTQRCPLLDQPPSIDGVCVLQESRNQVLRVPIEAVNAFVNACLLAQEELPTDQLSQPMIALLTALGGARGVLTCLGFRETPGSRVVAPLTCSQCLTSFLQLQSTKEKLTVGARAFTKHCQRSSDGFWGVLKGNDLMKNATALAKVQQLLDTAVWKNVHSLPHGEVTLEIRNAQGYGARWYIRDQSFRGFLEPQMENGHENRWRH